MASVGWAMVTDMVNDHSITRVRQSIEVKPLEPRLFLFVKILPVIWRFVGQLVDVKV
jgi:hypothetical protein